MISFLFRIITSTLITNSKSLFTVQDSFLNEENQNNFEVSKFMKKKLGKSSKLYNNI